MGPCGRAAADCSDASTARGTLTALGEQTGAIRWQTFIVPPGHDGGAVWSTPAIDTRTGRLYVGTGNAYDAPAAATTDSMMVLDARTGHILGHFQATGGDSFDAAGNPLGPDADFRAAPNLIGSRLVGEGAKNGVYYALDRASMKPLWRRQIGPGSAVGGILASTAFDGARIYGTDTLDGQLFAFDAAGSVRWVSLDPSTVDYSPVTVANGVLYSLDPLGVLVARDAGTGAPLAAMPLGGPDFGGISVVGKTIYAAIGTGPPPGLNADIAGSIVAFR